MSEVQKNQESAGGGMKRTDSKILLALSKKDEAGASSFKPIKSSRGEIPSAKKTVNEADQKRGMHRVSSQVNFGQVEVEQHKGQLVQKESQFKQQLEPQKGFDLSKIKTHYMHRRRLRNQNMVLKYGELFILTARESENHFHEDVLAFARYSVMQTCIIATNISDQERNFYIDMENIMPTIRKAYDNNTVIMVKDLLNEKIDEQYYFLREFLELRELKTLKPFRSSVVSI